MKNKTYPIFAFLLLCFFTTYQLKAEDINILVTSDQVQGAFLNPGDTVLFYVKVKNNSVSNVTSLIIDCDYSTMYTAVSAVSTPAGTSTSGTNPLLWNVGTLLGGEEKTLEITATIDSGASGVLLFNTSISADQTDSDDTLDDSYENYRVNPVLDKFTVKDIYIQEDGSSFCDADADPSNNPDFLGVTVLPGLLDGGYLPETVAIDIGYSDNDNDSLVINNNVYFDIPSDILPNSATITFRGTNFYGPEAQNRQSNTVFGSIQIDFETNTYSGYLYDFGDGGYQAPLGTDFSFVEADIGSAATTASMFMGRADFQDFTLSRVENRLILQHTGVSSPNGINWLDISSSVDDFSYLIEFYDGSEKSMVGVDTNPIQSFYISEGSTDDFVIDMTGNPDEILVQANITNTTPGDYRGELRGSIRMVIMKQDDGSYLASGNVMYDHGNVDDRITNFSFKDYVLTSNPSAPFVSANGIGHMGNGGFLADFRVYMSGSDIVIDQASTLYNGAYSMYTAQLRQYVTNDMGQFIPETVGSLGTTLAEGDVDTTIVGGEGSDFTFDIPTGAEVGTINFVTQIVSQGRSDNENGGVGTINIDFERDGSGNLIGVKGSGYFAYCRLGDSPDLVSFSDYDLENPVQMVNDTGLAPGVLSNRTNLPDFKDPQAGGVTLSYIPPTATELGKIRVQTVGNRNGNNAYVFEAANASWLGRNAVGLNNVPNWLTFNVGTYLGGGDYEFSLYDFNNPIPITVDLPDNFNNDGIPDGLLINFTNNPKTKLDFSIFVLSNTALGGSCPIVPDTTAEPNEGETFGMVDMNAVNNGLTVQQLLSTSSITPLADANGIAIIGFDNDTSEGAWQYSIDGGATWIDVPSDVSDTNALLLGNTSLLRFDFITDGSPTITYDAWDMLHTDKNIGDTGVDTTIVRGWEDTDGDGEIDQGFATEFSYFPDYATITSSMCYKTPTISTDPIPSISGISTLNRHQNRDASHWPTKVQSGALVLDSHSKGFVITRMNDPENSINTPVEGMLVYDIDDECLKLYDGSEWFCLRQSCNE